jgi:hypothetical protein
MALGRILRLRPYLDLDRARPLVFLSTCTSIYTGLYSNPTIFLTPSPALPLLLTQIQDATTANQNVAKVVGGAAVRNAKFGLLRTSMQSELCYVQSLCDAATPEVAQTIITAASMKTVIHNWYQKPVLSLKNGPTPGMVLLDANASLLDSTHRKKMFNWQLTTNGGTSFTGMPSSETGKTSVSGLTPLTRVGFQVSVSVNKQPQGPWSQTVTILVL